MLLCSRGVTTSAACELTARSLLRQVHADSFGGTSAGGAEESESELLCFQCYRPMAHPPAAGDLRLLDAQRGRHKCFHARCLAAMGDEKRARITQSADPWGGSCDKCPAPIGIAAFASPVPGLLRCKTCPAVFCAEHVPPYVCHLHGGIACGVCTQRLQAMGRQFQAGGGAWYAQTGLRGIAPTFSWNMCCCAVRSSPPQPLAAAQGEEEGGAATAAAPSSSLPSKRPRRVPKPQQPKDPPGTRTEALARALLSSPHP